MSNKKHMLILVLAVITAMLVSFYKEAHANEPYTQTLICMGEDQKNSTLLLGFDRNNHIYNMVLWNEKALLLFSKFEESEFQTKNFHIFEAIWGSDHPVKIGFAKSSLTGWEISLILDLSGEAKLEELHAFECVVYKGKES